MQKYHTTQKAAKTSNTCVLAIGYGDLQYVLNHESPIAYNAGADGWNFDLYKVNEKYSIVTGYRSMKRASTHDLLDQPELSDALKQLERECFGRELNGDERKQKLLNLLEKHLVC